MSLTTDLISYWKLDESSGNAADSVGSNTLTNTNTVGYGSAKINNGADLGTSNTDKKLSYTSNNLGIGTSDEVTITGWIKLKSEISSGEYKLLVHTNAGANGSHTMVYYQYNSGTRRLVFTRIGSSNDYVLSNGDIGTSNWVHLAITYNGSTGGTAYLNGSSVGTYSSSGTSNTGGTTGFHIGEYGGTNTDFASSMFDEVGIWSRVLSSAEITALYNSGNGLQYPFADTSFTPIIIQF